MMVAPSRPWSTIGLRNAVQGTNCVSKVEEKWTRRLDPDLPHVERRARHAARDQERDRPDDDPDPRKGRRLERMAQVPPDRDRGGHDEVRERKHAGADDRREQVDRTDGLAPDPDDPARHPGRGVRVERRQRGEESPGRPCRIARRVRHRPFPRANPPPSDGRRRPILAAHSFKSLRSGSHLPALAPSGGTGLPSPRASGS